MSAKKATPVYKEILDLLNKESVSGAGSGELVYKLDAKSTASVCIGESTVKVPLKLFVGHTHVHINGHQHRTQTRSMMTSPILPYKSLPSLHIKTSHRSI